MSKIKKFENIKGKVWRQFPEQCKSCGLCIAVCPKKCLSVDEETLGHFGQPTVKCDVEECIQCKLCEENCPEMAIRVKD